MKTPTDASIGTLIEALVSGGRPLDLLGAWITHVAPRVDFALLVLSPAAGDAAGLRREAGGWRAVAVPPIAVELGAAGDGRRSPGARRDDALDDLLATFGLGEAVVLPLGRAQAPRLVLARGAGAFGAEEVAALAGRAAWLAPALQATRAREAEASRGRRAAREFAAMQDIAREFSPFVGPREAALSAADAVQVQLGAVCGAVLVRIAPDARPLAALWPVTGATRDALDRAIGAVATEAEIVAADRHAVRSGEPGDLGWIDSDDGRPGAGYPRARLVAAFEGGVPDEARRVVPRIVSALGSALERIAVQRAAVEKRLLAAFRELPLGVVLLSPGSGMVRFANEKARTLLDTAGAAPDGTGRLDSVCGVRLAPLAEEAFSKGRAFAEVLVPRTEQVLELRVFPVAEPGDGSDAARDVQLVIEDVTEERRRAVTMARAERLSAMGVLVSGIVHEINNPLSTIGGYAQMLARDPESDDRERWIGLIDDEVRRCRKIVSDMLLLAREQKTDGGSVSLAALSERAIALLSHPFRLNAVDVSLRVEEGAPDVAGDADALMQVLINLLTNSMQALSDSDGERRVSVRVEAGAGGARLVVEDNGPGIPVELQERVFDPFFTTKPEGEGTGFGLSLVASTAERHGGSVDVVSAPGRGTTIAVTLPAVGDGGSRAPGSPPPAAASGVRTPLAGLSVLIVDDDARVAGVLRELLEASGAAVVCAAEGRSALDLALARRPDAIVSDLNMPGLDGTALFDELERRRPSLARRVIFTSGEPGDASGMHRGRPRLVKPFDARALIDAVRDVTGARPAPEPGPPARRPAPGGAR